MAAFKYYLGLDMGTNSVGWAVTDPNYNLFKAKGKTYGEYVNLMRHLLLWKDVRIE